MTDYLSRSGRIQDGLDAAGVDGLLITDLTNVRYLTGFSGTNGQVLVGPSQVIFLSDPRYEQRARELVRDAEIAIYPNRLTDILPGSLSAVGITRLGVEAGNLTMTQHEDLGARLEGVELVATKNVVERLRRTKDDEELALIRKAVAQADASFEWILDRITPGVSERALAFEIEAHMRQAGAEAVSFEPIVGSGPLSAHIHHTPGDRTLEKGDLVLLDFGCKISGYCSDLTRTVVLGAATDEQLDLYRLVLRAQEAALSAISFGAEAIACDRAARAVIQEAGHGERFGHGLGHGIGLDIHEQPTLNRISEDVLEPGNVVTVEPGVYLPGVGGIRIEDCVVVTAESCDVLGAAPKDTLIEL